MKTKAIRVFGIKTNNLKCIDVEIPYNKITAITGISGGGKSSLAYETIYSICNQEFKSLEKGAFEDSSYAVDGFSGIIPAISIRQNNYNSNPKSTIYSFLNLQSYIFSLHPSGDNKINHDLVKLNKGGNDCPRCCGGRYIYEISEELTIDRSIPIKENPFRPWHGHDKNRYTVMLNYFCDQEGIDKNRLFSELSETSKSNLLFGQSSYPVRLNYSVGGKKRARQASFCGVYRELDKLLSSNKISEYAHAIKYSKEMPCNVCGGSGINRVLYESSKIFGLSFFDFLTTPIYELQSKIEKSTKNNSSPAKEAINKKISALNFIGLGYLSLIRTIPSLSGGELQKLLFSQVLDTQLKNILFVIDEISAQLSAEDHDIFISSIRKISGNENTVILVEHNEDFISAADHVINIGPAPGKGGGYLCKDSGYQQQPEPEPEPFIKNKPAKFFRTPKITKNNVIGVEVDIPLGCLTGVFGRSGSGKSSFAKGLSEALDDVVYVSQKQLKGNSRSTLATYLELSRPISRFFSKKTGQDESFFLPTPGSPSTCETCSGTGQVEITRTFEKTVRITCTSCNGLLFSEKNENIKANQVSIRDFYSCDISELPLKFSDLPKRVSEIILAAEKLGVSHLSLNRRVSSLSGGEARRLKLIKSLLVRSGSRILIIDEPGAGLDNYSARKAISYIREMSVGFKAILVIDHTDRILKECDYAIKFGPGSGPNGGIVVYSGTFEKYKFTQNRGG